MYDCQVLLIHYIYAGTLLASKYLLSMRSILETMNLWIDGFAD